MSKPIIAITMGDPASIGPELCLQSFHNPSLYGRCHPLVVGHHSFLQKAMAIEGMPQLFIHPITQVSEAIFSYGTIDVLDVETPAMNTVRFGELSVAAGEASFQYVKTVIELAMRHDVDATVTNAINKEAVNLSGHHFAGHTEIYAHYTDTSSYTMLLAHENLRIVHVSTHVSLRQACDKVKKERVLEVIRIADKACKQMGITSPKIGVAGLNPHCGEGGLFGSEEIDEIMPAIDIATAEGLNVEGPIPPDTIFSKARGGWYDIVVAMYHDQGHIPLKVVGFVYDSELSAWQAVSGVNITLGLPVIRTSVDHGTAFDQAGKGTASPLSLDNAIDYAVRFARNQF